MRVEELKAKLAALTASIAKDRDALRELIDDAEALVESGEEAIDDMRRAADALSRYV